MSRPTSASWDGLKRIGRYLKGVPRLVQHFKWAEHDVSIEGFADSDWAGDKATMKSTSGGVVMWGPHCIKAWSTSQSTLALSSGEAELYAMTKMAVQMSGMISLASDFNITLHGIIKSDSNAAIGIAHRDGLGGRCTHIKVQYLWIQSKIRSKELGLRKVLGTENPADLMTKPLSSDLFDKYLDMMCFYKCGGRACTSSRLLNSMTPSITSNRRAAGTTISRL